MKMNGLLLMLEFKKKKIETKQYGKFWSFEKKGICAQPYCNYKNSNSLSNNIFHLCGNGIYCSPTLNFAYNYKNDDVVIMCRVNPKKLRIVKGKEKTRWIVDGTRNSIRPYILLFKDPYHKCLIY